MNHFEDAGYIVGQTLAEHPDRALYRAVDRSTGAEVVLRAQWRAALPWAVEFGMREQHLLPLLARHPGLVPVLRTAVLPNGVRLVVTPWYPEGSLADRPAPDRDGDWPTAVRAVLGIVDGLDHAHRLGIFHGDLRAHWVMADGDMVRLNGFGAAREAFVERFGSEQIVGTNPGLPPELVSSEVGAVYGLAALAVEIAWGAPLLDRPVDYHARPWTAEDFEAHSAPPPIAALLARAADTDRQQRPPTIRAFAAELTEAARAAGIAVAPLPAPVEIAVPEPLPVSDWPTAPFTPRLGVELPFGWRVQDTVELASPLSSAEAVIRHLAADRTLTLDELAQRLRPGLGDRFGTGSSGPTAAGPEAARLDDGGAAVRSRWTGEADGHITFLLAAPLPLRVVTVTSAVADSANRALGSLIDRMARGVTLRAPALSAGSRPGTFRRRSGLSVPLPDGWDVGEQAGLIDPGGHQVVTVTVHHNDWGYRDLDAADDALWKLGPSRRAYRERWSDRRSTELGPVAVSAFDWQPFSAAPTTTTRLVALLSSEQALEAEADLASVEFDSRSEEILQILLSLSYGSAPPPRPAANPEIERDETESAIDAFVRAAVDVRWIDDVDAESVPPEMWHGEPDRDGEVGWQPMPSTVTTAALADLETELGVQLPSSYRSFLLAAHLGNLDIHDVSFRAQLPDTWAANLRAKLPALRQAVLPVAHVDLEEWDFHQNIAEFCFDLRSRGSDGDCPVFVSTTSGNHWVFSSGTAMFGSLAVLARCERNPITAGGPDLEQFLAVDPQGTDAMRAWWRSFSRSRG